MPLVFLNLIVLIGILNTDPLLVNLTPKKVILNHRILLLVALAEGYNIMQILFSSNSKIPALFKTSKLKVSSEIKDKLQQQLLIISFFLSCGHLKQNITE